MRKRTLNPRELWLLLSAVGLVVVWLTSAWIQPGWEEWRKLRRSRLEARNRMREYDRLIENAPAWQRQLESLRALLPTFPAGRDVSSELLRNIERLAAEHGLTLTRRETSRERATPEYYQQSITCQWEGTLASLVRFLFALQSGEGAPDVSQLTVSPSPSAAGSLRGAFTIDHTYLREAAPRAADVTAVSEDRK